MSLYECVVNPDFEDLPPVLNLSGVSLEGRQDVIKGISLDEKIELRRDYHNIYDKNAIGVFLKDNTQLGWIQKQHAAILAPEIDCGVVCKARIERIIGGSDFMGVLIKLFI